MQLRPLCEHPSKLRILLKLVEQPRRALVIIEAHRIIIHTFEGPLAVPDEKLELPRRNASPGCVPIRRMIPIRIGPVKIQNQKINQLGQVEQTLKGAKLRVSLQ